MTIAHSAGSLKFRFARQALRWEIDDLSPPSQQQTHYFPKEDQLHSLPNPPRLSRRNPPQQQQPPAPPLTAFDYSRCCCPEHRYAALSGKKFALE